MTTYGLAKNRDEHLHVTGKVVVQVNFDVAAMSSIWRTPRH